MMTVTFRNDGTVVVRISGHERKGTGPWTSTAACPRTSQVDRRSPTRRSRAISSRSLRVAKDSDSRAVSRAERLTHSQDVPPHTHRVDRLAGS